MANARAKAEQAEMSAKQALKDSELARIKAKEFAPEFVQPGNHANRKLKMAWLSSSLLYLFPSWSIFLANYISKIMCLIFFLLKNWKYISTHSDGTTLISSI